MLIKLLSIGSQMPDWVKEGYNEYAKRLTQDIRLELIELPTKKRTKNATLWKIQEYEEHQLLNSAAKCDWVVALDPKGSSLSTEGFSDQLHKWQLQGLHNIGFLIGGPEGLTKNCIDSAHFRFSLSHLTFPHPLVRVIVAEQIYRGWSLLKSHPYHR